jgi:hypothetical protein
MVQGICSSVRLCCWGRAPESFTIGPDWFVGFSGMLQVTVTGKTTRKQSRRNLATPRIRWRKRLAQKGDGKMRYSLRLANFSKKPGRSKAGRPEQWNLGSLRSHMKANLRLLSLRHENADMMAVTIRPSSLRSSLVLAHRFAYMAKASANSRFITLNIMAVSLFESIPQFSITLSCSVARPLNSWLKYVGECQRYSHSRNSICRHRKVIFSP